MQKALNIVVAMLIAAAAVYSQSSVPTPTPKNADDDVVKISTNVIQLDVSVTDRDGRVVRDLRPDEFEVYENGRRQKITGFSFVSRGQKKGDAQPAAGLSKQPPVPAAPPPTIRPEQVRRTIALIVDDLSMSFESIGYTKRSMKKFVDEQMADGDMVAIIRTSAGIGALQQFTTDKRILYAAIDKVRFVLSGRGTASAFEPIRPTPLEKLQQAGDSKITAQDLAEEKNRADAFNDYVSGLFATGTLGAAKYVIGGMSELPGRKSIILFSDGFKLTEKDRTGEDLPAPILDLLRPLIDLANRASVVLYAVDPRGLQYTGITAADEIANPKSGSYVSGKLAERSKLLFDTQAGLEYLAEATGGFVIKNTNDLSGGVQRVLDDQSYYLIAYEPEQETFDAAARKFNNINIKVLKKDVDVRYRSGFFSVPDAKKPPVARKLTPVQQLERAIYSPFGESGLSLRMTTLFGNDPVAGEYVTSLLHIDPSKMTFVDKPGGQKQLVFGVLAASFGESGAIADQIGKTYTFTAPRDVYEKVMKDGIVYHFRFPIKIPGPYQLRVAIRDNVSGLVGSANQFVDVPDVRKKRLTLSSILLERLTADEYQRSLIPGISPLKTDPMTDTAMRIFKVGSVLRYAFEVYNANLGAAGVPEMQTRVRVFREGQLVLDGNPKPFVPDSKNAGGKFTVFGAVSIGSEMEPGDYVLQVIVTDIAMPKAQTQSQYIQFEVVP